MNGRGEGRGGTINLSVVDEDCYSSSVLHDPPHYWSRFHLHFVLILVTQPLSQLAPPHPFHPFFLPFRSPCMPPSLDAAFPPSRSTCAMLLFPACVLSTHSLLAISELYSA
ncbi:hypothetical protein E2C01_063131 [Portunus trituberculatus]|uniref:Uncharacterized protein n=1 Tax=Portunus trituberculatus TaxID=210409 RepID=A0A5B7H9P0_PORTR|nr:hypothetical protein [Portunus trituberculatus]